MEKLLFKKIHPEANLPTRGSSDSCGLDVYSVEDIVIEPGSRKAVRTGFAVAVPVGFYGRMAPRSGLALKFGIDVLAGSLMPIIEERFYAFSSTWVRRTFKLVPEIGSRN